MAAAVVRASYYGASATIPAGVTAETGIVFNRVDTQTGTTPLPIPTATGVNFSYIKALALEVTTTGTTSINNRTTRMSGSLATGLGMHWKIVTQANWATAPTAGINQQSATQALADTTGANNAASAQTGYTVMTTSAVQFDNTSQATTSTGIASLPLLVIMVAVDATYAGGPGSASLGNIILGYDEA